MTLDTALLLLLVLFAVAGAISGALRQLVQAAAAVAGWAAARWLAPLLVPVLLSAPRPWQRGAVAVGCFAVTALVVGWLGQALARRLHGPSGTPGLLDRALGALLSAANVALAAWVVLSALALHKGPIGVGGYSLDVRRSEAGAFAARHNLLADGEVRRLLEQVEGKVGK